MTLIKTTGVYQYIQYDDKWSMKQLLNKYNVGIEKTKKTKICYSDPALMLPLRRLPHIATTLLRKQCTEMTNHAGISNMKDGTNERSG